AVAIGLPFGTGAASSGSANTTFTDATGAGVAAVATVRGIGLEIAAEINRPAILQLWRAIRSYTLAAAAGDGDKLARAKTVAGAAVIEIGLQVDATGAGAKRQAGGAGLGDVLSGLGRPYPRGDSGDHPGETEAKQRTAGSRAEGASQSVEALF